VIGVLVEVQLEDSIVDAVLVFSVSTGSCNAWLGIADVTVIAALVNEVTCVVSRRLSEDEEVVKDSGEGEDVIPAEDVGKANGVDTALVPDVETVDVVAKAETVCVTVDDK
jgi:hypothetical protein